MNVIMKSGDHEELGNYQSQESNEAMETNEPINHKKRVHFDEESINDGEKAIHRLSPEQLKRARVSFPTTEEIAQAEAAAASSGMWADKEGDTDACMGVAEPLEPPATAHNKPLDMAGRSISNPPKEKTTSSTQIKPAYQQKQFFTMPKFSTAQKDTTMKAPKPTLKTRYRAQQAAVPEFQTNAKPQKAVPEFQPSTKPHAVSELGNIGGGSKISKSPFIDTSPPVRNKAPLIIDKKPVNSINIQNKLRSNQGASILKDIANFTKLMDRGNDEMDNIREFMRDYNVQLTSTLTK
jgi:hypothetical protein